MPDRLPHDKDAALKVAISTCEYLEWSNLLCFLPQSQSGIPDNYDRGFRMAFA